MQLVGVQQREDRRSERVGENLDVGAWSLATRCSTGFESQTGLDVFFDLRELVSVIENTEDKTRCRGMEGTNCGESAYVSRSGTGKEENDEKRKRQVPRMHCVRDGSNGRSHEASGR